MNIPDTTTVQLQLEQGYLLEVEKYAVSIVLIFVIPFLHHLIEHIVIESNSLIPLKFANDDKVFSALHEFQFLQNKFKVTRARSAAKQNVSKY